VTAVFSIASKSYLAFARTLMSSVRREHPEMQRFLILVDRDFEGPGEDFTVIPSELLPVPKRRWVHFKYNILELSTALKPYAASYIASEYGADKLFYFDPDIRLYRSIAALDRALDASDIVLTPHIVEPMREDGKLPSEFEIVRNGSYNLGFIGLRANRRGCEFLEWWQRKLYDHAYVDVEHGLFTDQKWVDLVPSVFPKVHIERSPAYNVAYWNIGQRKVERSGGSWWVNGEPLRFFHFSGFDPMRPLPFSKNQNRYTLDDLGDVKPLAIEYADEVIENGHGECRAAAYAYGFFQNGTPLPDLCRRWARGYPAVVDRIDDPFGPDGYDAFVEYWTAPSEHHSGAAITRLARAVYDSRPDVRRKWPDIESRDRYPYLEWLAADEHGLPAPLLAPIQAAVRRERQRASEEQRRRELPRRLQSEWNALPRPVAALVPSEFPEDILRAGSVRAWLAENVPYGGVTLPRLATLILDRTQGFDEARASRPGRFLAWLTVYGRSAYELDAGLLRPIVDALRAQMPSARLPLIFFSAASSARAVLDAIQGRPPARVAGELVEHAPVRLQIRENRERAGAPGPPAADGLNIYGIGDAAEMALAAARSAGIPVSFNQPVYDVNLYYTRPDHRRGGAYNIVFCDWGADDCFDCDELWTPSRFRQDAIARNANVPVVRMPGAVGERSHEPPKRNNGRFTFVALRADEAVVEAFRAVSDRAALVIDDDEGVIASCDCLVALRPCAGFDYKIAQAMQAQRPVIASAYADAALPGNCFAADASSAAVAQQMRSVIDDSNLRAEVARRGHEFVRRHLNVLAVGALMKERLQTITGRRPSAPE
jgi:hypothetical protein